MANKICKIVYFDEESVTDYVQIIAGGELESTTELLKTKDAHEQQTGEVTAKGGIGGVFRALLGWEASASGEVSGELSFNSSRMVKNIVKNTILTDFLHLLDDSTKKNQSRVTRGAIKKFDGYIVSAEKDSLSYMVMVSPYLSMLKSGTSIPAGDFNIAIEKLENTDLTDEQKQKIIIKWYSTVLSALKDDEREYIETTNIKEWFINNAGRYDNIRILKTKLEYAVFEKLTDHFIIESHDKA